MIFAIECIVSCLFFTLMVELTLTKKREALFNDYPPVVTDKLRAMGLIAEEPPAKKTDIIRKLIAIVIYAILFALLLRYVNGIETFLEGMLTAYALKETERKVVDIAGEFGYANASKFSTAFQRMMGKPPAQ